MSATPMPLELRRFPTRPTAIRSLPVMGFPPVGLALDDRLKGDILLVLGYDHPIDPDSLERAVAAGLELFPHLTGRLERGADEPQWSIIPSSGPTQLEIVEAERPLAFPDLGMMPQAELVAHFVPDFGESGETPSLFGMRLTHCGETGMCVLGARVSHAAMDGAGMGWFARACSSAWRRDLPPRVMHDRQETFAGILDCAAGLPDGYRDEGALTAGWAWRPDPWTASPPVIFEVQVDAACRFLGGTSLLDTRLRFSAWLCAELARLAPGLEKLALWCDARVAGGVPKDYTGNAGCFLHFPLRGKRGDELTRDLKTVTSRRGVARVRKSYQQIKRSEADGRMVVWDGPGEDVLQLNLLPRQYPSVDFNGPPGFAMLLSRNSSGLRISFSPGGAGFMVEASLARGWGDALVEVVRKAGLNPEPCGCAVNSVPDG